MLTSDDFHSMLLGINPLQEQKWTSVKKTQYSTDQELRWHCYGLGFHEPFYSLPVTGSLGHTLCVLLN